MRWSAGPRGEGHRQEGEKRLEAAPQCGHATVQPHHGAATPRCGHARAQGHSTSGWELSALSLPWPELTGVPDPGPLSPSVCLHSFLSVSVSVSVTVTGWDGTRPQAVAPWDETGLGVQGGAGTGRAAAHCTGATYPWALDSLGTTLSTGTSSAQPGSHH